MSEEITKEEIIEQFKGNKILKVITVIVGVVVLGIIGFFAYNKFVAEPNEVASNSENATGLMYLEKDSTDLAIEELEGPASSYNGYSGGEVAQFALASAYFKKGQYEEALAEVKDVKLEDTYVATLAIGMEGDCQSELGNYQEAVSAYVKAAERVKNDVTTPMYLFKAGLNAEEAGDFSKATELYTKINDEYSAYASQNGIEKYIARAENKTKK